MLLSNPAQFGDVIAPSIEEDARGYLGAALVEIGAGFGPYMRSAASCAIAALGEADGMDRGILEARCADEMDLDDTHHPRAALRELSRRSIVEIRSGRVYLNPAVSEAVTRELFR